MAMPAMEGPLLFESTLEKREAVETIAAAVVVVDLSTCRMVDEPCRHRRVHGRAGPGSRGVRAPTTTAKVRGRGRGKDRGRGRNITHSPGGNSMPALVFHLRGKPVGQVPGRRDTLLTPTEGSKTAVCRSFLVVVAPAAGRNRRWAVRATLVANRSSSSSNSRPPRSSNRAQAVVGARTGDSKEAEAEGQRRRTRGAARLRGEVSGS